MTDTPDLLLVERAQHGDRQAMDALVTKYQARAFQFAYRLSGDPDDAADLVADAFVRVYSAITRFRKESQFSTWLFRIITNCFLDKKKKDKSRQTLSLDDDSGLDELIASTDESPEDASSRASRDALMMAAVGKLPEYQRAMIVMYHVEMLSYEDIAQALDMPIGTVKSRLNRARLALREMLEPYSEHFLTG